MGCEATRMGCYKEKSRIIMRIFILNFLLSAAPLSTVPMYADENGSAKSALFFESLPACQKPPKEFFDTLKRSERSALFNDTADGFFQPRGKGKQQ